MWKVLCLLGVLAVPLKSHHLLRLDIGGMHARVFKGILEKVQHSFTVPIWQYSPADDFICEEVGYFPDPRHCQYFYKCTAGRTDHLFRFIYRCDEGRVYSKETNSCVRAEESDRECAKTPEDYTSMEVEDNKAKPDQQTFDDGTVKKPSLGNELTNKDEEKFQSDGSDVNAPTQKPLSDVKNTVQPFDDGEEDEDTVSVQTTLPPIPERQTTLPPISERQTTVPPIPEMETDEKNEEVPTTVTPISTTTLPSISETEEDRKEQLITADVADHSVCYDGKESLDCADEGFYGVPEDCSKFYRCVSFGSHFVKYELQCPFGTIWDNSLHTCNFRAAVKEITCRDTSLPVTTAPPTSPTSPTSITATASTTPPPSPDDSDNDCPFDDIPEDRTGIICPTGFRQHPRYCNMFYQCISRDNFEANITSLVCPDNMVFNMELLQCEKNETRRIGCNIFEPTEKQDDGRILIHSNLQLCPEEGRFIYGERCSSLYIECLRDENGKLEGYLYTCPSGQMYSTVRDRCRNYSYFHHCMLEIKKLRFTI